MPANGAECVSVVVWTGLDFHSNPPPHPTSPSPSASPYVPKTLRRSRCSPSCASSGLRLLADTVAENHDTVNVCDLQSCVEVEFDSH